MIRGFVSFALLAAAHAGVGQAAAAAKLQQPTAKWVVDYGDTYCTGSRTYGTAAQPVSLAFRPSPMGSVVRLMIVRRGRVAMPHHFKVTVSAAAAKSYETGLRFQTGGKKLDVTWINLDRAVLQGVADSNAIELVGVGEINEQFAVPGFAAVLKALDTCNEDLRKLWHVGDAGTQLSRRASPQRPLAEYVASDDYPTQARREDVGGTVGFALMVDETGTLKDCVVTETSGVATLDAMACGVLLDRAKFVPALDLQGKPTRDVLTSRIRWKMP